jgi:hypothetical protein
MNLTYVHCFEAQQKLNDASICYEIHWKLIV